MMNLTACILMGAVSLTPVFAASDAAEKKLNFCQDPLTDGFIHVGPNIKEGIHHTAVTRFGPLNPDGTEKLRRYDPSHQLSAVQEAADNSGLQKYEGAFNKDLLQIIGDMGEKQKEMWWNTQKGAQLKQINGKPCLPLLWRIQKTNRVETSKWLSTSCTFEFKRDPNKTGYIYPEHRKFIKITFYDECGKRIFFYKDKAGRMDQDSIHCSKQVWDDVWRRQYWSEGYKKVLVARTDQHRFLHMHLQSFYQTPETHKLTKEQEELQQKIRKWLGLPETYKYAKRHEIKLQANRFQLSSNGWMWAHYIKEYEEELEQKLAKERAEAIPLQRRRATSNFAEEAAKIDEAAFHNEKNSCWRSGL